MMIALRIYLLCGLVFHKVVWEVLKRRNPHHANARPAPPIRVRLIKGVKTLILLGFVVQTVIWQDILPISDEPLVLRVVGVALFTIGLLVAVFGRLLLGDNWSDIEAAEVFGDHRVVRAGIYQYIRHPIYVGDLLLICGLELALNSWLVLGVALLTPVVLRQAVREEMNLRKTLPDYEAYCAETKRFIPFVV